MHNSMLIGSVNFNHRHAKNKVCSPRDSILQCARNPHARVSLLTLGTAHPNFLHAELYREKQRSSTELLNTEEHLKLEVD